MTLRIGIVGLGQHAETLARAIAGTEGSRLVAAASRSAERAAEFSRLFGVQGHDSYAGLIARDDLDLVIVSTANDMHRDVTVDALRSGKHVLCEKPLALTSEDALAMVGAARDAGRSLFVGYHLRHLAIVDDMRSRIARGDIGDSIDLALNRASQFTSGSVGAWRRDLGQAGGGVLCDVAPHLVDLVWHLTGEEVIAVQATARPDRSSGLPDDQVFLTLSLAGGGVARVAATRGVAGAESTLHVHGSTGSLCTSSLRWADTHELVAVREGESTTIAHPAGNSHRESIDGIVAALGGAASIAPTGIDGLRGVRVLEAAIEALSSNRLVPVVPH